MRRVLGTVLVAASMSLTAFATNIYSETGDAGQSLSSAQFVNLQPGGTALDAIRGVLDAGDADIFAIYLTGGRTFSATTTASSLLFNTFDTQLFLFNSSGVGVYANDDDPSSPPQSTLPAAISLTPSASGIYYLAISGSGYLPVSSGGFIFPVSGGLLDPSGGSSGAVGPTGPGGSSLLSGWFSTSSESGGYEIILTGAQFLPDTGVPEPSTGLLLGAGLTVLVFFRKRILR
jgi:hypothetical protein